MHTCVPCGPWWSNESSNVTTACAPGCGVGGVRDTVVGSKSRVGSAADADADAKRDDRRPEPNRTADAAAAPPRPGRWCGRCAFAFAAGSSPRSTVVASATRLRISISSRAASL